MKALLFALSLQGSAGLPTALEWAGHVAPDKVRKWAGQVPPDVMKLWLSTMPPGTSRESALTKRVGIEGLLRMSAEEDAQQHSTPTKSQVDEVERVLTQDKCIVNLNRWSKRYTYYLDYGAGRVDDNKVAFELREAGWYGFANDRKIGKPHQFAMLDDRQFRLAAGTYKLREHRLTVDHCGWNAPDRPHRHENPVE